MVSCLGKVPSMMDGQPRLALQLQRLSWEAAACPSGLLVKGSFMGGTLCASDSEPLRKGPDIEDRNSWQDHIREMGSFLYYYYYY